MSVLEDLTETLEAFEAHVPVFKSSHVMSISSQRIAAYLGTTRDRVRRAMQSRGWRDVDGTATERWRVVRGG